LPGNTYNNYCLREEYAEIYKKPHTYKADILEANKTYMYQILT